MPTKPLSPCTWPGCGRATRGRHCPAHRRESERVRDQGRPSASQRGYTSSRWRRLRAAKLALDPFCECERCARLHLVTPATEVDHRIPHQGPTDWRFWDWTNLQSLSKSCHARKTATQDSSFARRAAPAIFEGWPTGKGGRKSGPTTVLPRSEANACEDEQRNP